MVGERNITAQPGRASGVQTASWYLLGVVLSLLFASGLLFGWTISGFQGIFSTPLTYQGDGLAISWTIQRTIEGWPYDNLRSGWPFGSNFLDYPGSELGNYLVLKVLSFFSDSYVTVLNLFVLLSFPAVFAAAFAVMRSLGLMPAYAFSGALLYAFLPFHFLRIDHLFYLWYFVAPIFMYVGFRIFEGQPILSNTKNKYNSMLLVVFYFTVLASFGVYYALFGVIVLGVSGVAGSFKSSGLQPIKVAFFGICAITFGVLINIAPNIVHSISNSENSEVAVRHSSEAEVYGLKMMQLVLPRLGHRQTHLSSITSGYISASPLNNENTTSSLGVVGAFGFFALGLVVLARMSGAHVDSRLAWLALLAYVLFLFGTIGGLGSLFSHTVSPSIRGWNRISIFIAFASISGALLLLQLAVKKILLRHSIKWSFMIPLALIGLGMWDQTTSACLACNNQNKSSYELDKVFVREIESRVDAGGAIYQLPYMPFPEVAPLHRLHTYDLVVGFLHSKSLRWSYAGMKGREGDLFYRALSKESIKKQIEIVTRMGFSGVYIDRRGFEDGAKSLIDRLTLLIGNGPILKRADEEVVFFKLPPNKNSDMSGLSSFDIMKSAGYVVDKLGSRHPASLVDGIDFTRRSWPEFIRDVNGISGPEPWGRWSDANLGQGVRFDLFSPLPDRFTLVLFAHAFGHNGEQVVDVRIGNQTHRFVLHSRTSEVRIPVILRGSTVDAIEFMPQHPVSPQELGLSDDTRNLGIGFVQLRFVE